MFLLGGYSHKFRYIDIFGLIAIMLFFYAMPIAFYNLDYEMPDRLMSLDEKLFVRPFAILKHLGEPVRTLVIIQPLAYFTGKMCFEIYKTLKG